MNRPAHTPYDGRSKPFAIGLKTCDADSLVEVDGQLYAYLAEKQRLFAEAHDDVFRAEPETEAAQGEVLSLAMDILPRRFPETHRREGAGMRIACGNGIWLVRPGGDAPLMTAARMVQEDLVIMRRGAEGWRIAAAAVCFPSSWRLSEKYGKPLDAVHAPVPGFGAGTRMAEMIGRIFDNLKPGLPAERWNWSVHGDKALHHPGPGGSALAGEADPAAAAFIRVERQTLSRLPQTGDILFTIRIHVDPLGVLRRMADGPVLAAGLAGQIRALDEAQIAYKGMGEYRDRLLAGLDRIATFAT